MDGDYLTDYIAVTSSCIELSDRASLKQFSGGLYFRRQSASRWMLFNRNSACSDFAFRSMRRSFKGSFFPESYNGRLFFIYLSASW